MLQLMDLLFSFLEPMHPHSTVLAGYFSKVSESCCYHNICERYCFVYDGCNMHVDPIVICLINSCLAAGCGLSHVAEDGPAYDLCSSK